MSSLRIIVFRLEDFAYIYKNIRLFDQVYPIGFSLKRRVFREDMEFFRQ